MVMVRLSTSAIWRVTTSKGASEEQVSREPRNASSDGMEHQNEKARRVPSSSACAAPTRFPPKPGLSRRRLLVICAGCFVSQCAALLVMIYALERSCDAMSASACFDEATAIVTHALKRRTAEAARPRCEAGEKNACFTLAWAYDKGEGVDKDTVRATRLYKKGCDGGHAASCNNFGVVESNADNKVHAAQLFDQACAGGSARACANLGDAYLRGAGIEANLARGMTLIERACEKGVQFGCLQLGRHSMRGEGVIEDKQKGLRLLRGACESGEQPWACGDLGAAYRHGDGIELDDRRAKQLYRRACDAGVAKACRELAELSVRTRLEGGARTVFAGRGASSLAGARSDHPLRECVRTDRRCGGPRRGIAATPRRRRGSDVARTGAPRPV